MTTINLPAFSDRRATCNAAQRAAPDEMPTSRPSSRAARRAVSKVTDQISYIIRDSHGLPFCPPGGIQLMSFIGSTLTPRQPLGSPATYAPMAVAVDLTLEAIGHVVGGIAFFGQ